MKILLDENKPFYKANLHIHSHLSDGKHSPERLKEEYKQRGYSIVAFTDHEHLIDNSHLDDEEFLTITSCELAVKEFSNQSTLKNFSMKAAHFNAYALDQHNTLTPCHSRVYERPFINDNCRELLRESGEYEREYSAEGINRMIAEVKRQGFLVSYNHPSWSLEDARNYMAYEGMDFVEIYNHSCVQMGHNDDEDVFDDLLRADKHVFCTACDDAHNRQPFDAPESDCFGGWVSVNADNLEYGEVMTALANGDFYASTGPSILSLVLDGDKVRVKTSGARCISYITKGRKRKTVFAEKGDVLTEAEFTVSDTDEYFRIRVTDGEGKRAYTQAYSVL